jgi:hypothetical protein
MAWLLVQALWFGLAAAIILVDRQLMTKPVESVDPQDLAGVDLKDRSVGPFLLMMVVFGGLVIPFYLWYSRRSGAAVAAGVGLMLACGAVVAVASAALLR